MKKFVSLLVVALMLVSALALNVSAAQTNHEVTIPKFTAKPTFDGVISEEEWGTKTFRLTTDMAATDADEEVSYDEASGVRNCWYYDTSGLYADLAYDLWLRWDDEYLYIAAIVEDADPFSAPKDGAEAWDNDCIQFRFDPAGPSASMLKTNPAFNYKTDEFKPRGMGSKPWTNNFDGVASFLKGKDASLWLSAGENSYNLEKDGALVGITTVPNDEEGTCVINYEFACPWKSIDATLVPAAGSVYGMSLAVGSTDSSGIEACLQWGCGIMFNDKQPLKTRGGSQALVLGSETVAPASSYETAGEEAQPEETDKADKNDSSVTNKGDKNEPADTNKGNNNKKPDITTVDTGFDFTVLVVPAIIVVVLLVVVVAAVVIVIVVMKKKKK